MRISRDIRATLALAVAVAALLAVPAYAGAPPSGAFDRNGMWIWYVSKSSGGDPDAIVERARRHGVGTVYIKSGDDRNYWSQFSARLIRTLKAGGLDVCAWQFVYGDHPKDEAKVAAHAIEK